ncbi:beta-lactamase family protein [Agromyces intestinalis]|uniref:Beta-lactamase family protein n=1 Tax=Agromyces intestinalis TaxID=2592652 RepID=A0A5C1YIN8_9MICO|nr:serine hydrolase domain-containing protein [Agromyces intestinalis]QEO14917.1 beta-lactamase family protein [Agromyces intestinalis]
MTDLQQDTDARLHHALHSLAETAIAAGTETGVQLTVFRDGRLVADVAAGTAEPRGARPVTPDTLVYSASTGKAVASTVAHVLVERGLFELDTPLVEFWPEFGAHGKQGITLRHVLTHSAGLPALPLDITVEQLTDWEWMSAMLAGAEPRWAPGERVGYHAGTFGHLVGEFVRRATGRPISQVLADEVAGPLGIADELYFGVPDRELPRVATLENDPQGHAIFTSLPDQFPLFQAAPRQVVPDAVFGNRADVLTSDLPYQGTMTARALARMYAALVGEVDGVRLVSPDRLAALAAPALPGAIDEVTGAPAIWSVGYAAAWPPASGSDASGDAGVLRDVAPGHPTSFGMGGIGGSGGWADPVTRVAVAVTKTRFNPVDASLMQQVTDLVRGWES